MSSTIYDYFNSNNTGNNENLENKFNEPMPLIGFYIFVASFICTIIITVDTLLNFARGRLWFPCKLFSLNAASLTVIAVSMKLPVDLNNPMYGRLDQLAKFSSSVFMCTMLASFMPSLGAMEDTELVMNMVALIIMVITICVNLSIQIATELIIPAFKQLYILTIYSMILMLMILICSALTVSVSKKVLKSKYQEMHTEIVDLGNSSEHDSRKEELEKLQRKITKYWIMAITCSPQFVMASSEACCACGALCVVVDVFLILSVKTVFTYDNVRNCDSVYKGLIIKILIVQCIGVVLGSIAPIFRLLAAFSFRLSRKWSRNYLQVYRIDSYWTQQLVLWKQINPCLDDLLVGGRMFRKSMHNMKNYILDLSIVFVTIVAILSKIVRLLAYFLVILFVYCYFGFRAIKRKCMNDPSAAAIHNDNGFVTQSESVRRFALQFHDGVELSDRTLNNITNGIERFVESARKRKPKNLIDFLEKSRDFNGVLSFNNDQIPHLNSQEPPNSWSLSVITLTSIVLALPNIEKGAADLLLNNVKKGLSYVKHVEETLDCKGDLVVIRKAGDVVWHGVELDGMWLESNLKKQSRSLGWLSEEAKAIVMKERSANVDQETPFKWSINTIAANSMYRVCETIMLELDHQESDKQVFEKISIMIADILCACLMNLARAISIKCYSGATGKREESVRRAATIFGETEEIMKSLSERDLPSCLDLHQMASMDEWRHAIKL